MSGIHTKLAVKFPWYAKWHEQRGCQFYHWLVLVLSAVLFSSGLSSNINRGLGQIEMVQTSLDNRVPSVSLDKTVRESPDYILLKFKSGLSGSQKDKLFLRHGLKETNEIKQIGVKIVSIPNTDTPQEIVDRLRANERANIEFAETDRIIPPSLVPNDPWWPNQWYHPKISDPAAWDITTGVSTVIVAIGDTGVDCVHEDLAGKCLPGWNFYDKNSNTSDVYGHGTKVAGTVVANTNNAVGIAAICWNCKILPIRVSGTDGYATYSALAQAITYAADNGAKVINESYMASESSTVQSAARYMQNKGGVVTISAGNYGTFVSTPDVPEIITVGATDPNDALYSWSNSGNIIDLVAPGCVYTTIRGGGYSSGCGTSFSAPIVAGVAALLYSANPSLTAGQVQDILKQSANDLGVIGKDTTFGWGRVNAGTAVGLATGVSPTLSPSSSPTPTPIPTPTSTPTPTPSISPTPTPFSIINYSVSKKTSTTATITWTTSLPSTGVASYGTASINLNLSATDGVAGTSHKVVLSGLTPLTKYFYQITAVSVDTTSTISLPVSNFKTLKK